jgi:hypothetical protein
MRDPVRVNNLHNALHNQADGVDYFPNAENI